jgi:hypothetical protein
MIHLCRSPRMLYLVFVRLGGWLIHGGPFNSVQGHRAARSAARGCCAAPRPSRPRRDWADPSVSSPRSSSSCPEACGRTGWSPRGPCCADIAAWLPRGAPARSCRNTPQAAKTVTPGNPTIRLASRRPPDRNSQSLPSVTDHGIRARTHHAGRSLTPHSAPLTPLALAPLRQCPPLSPSRSC